MLRFSNQFDSQTWIPVEQLRKIEEKDIKNNENVKLETFLKKAKFIVEEIILLLKSNFSYELHDFKKKLQSSEKILENLNSLDSSKEYLILLHMVDFMFTEISEKLRKKPTYIWIEAGKEYSYEKLHEFIMSIHTHIYMLQSKGNFS